MIVLVCCWIICNLLITSFMLLVNLQYSFAVLWQSVHWRALYSGGRIGECCWLRLLYSGG